MLRLIHHNRNLMSTEGAFNLLSINYLWSCPSLWCTKNDHWPLMSCCIIIFTGILLDCLDLVHCLIKSICHLSVHFHRITAFYEIWLPTTSIKEVLYFLMSVTCEDGRIADLISVQMKDWKNGTIINWV